ncbi:MAG: Ribosomal protein L11 methyltransferase [Burkholderiaceae bacterium]|jgi:ribosomal protein L11 methyltransferase|nr:MAG: Ribosomal protein L11 methyltransferase [Burkholderiaceae bacterium]
MHELNLLCPQQRVEAVCDALEALDALAVTVEDADAQDGREQPLFGEPGLPPPAAGWQRSRVSALFATENIAKDAESLLAVQDFFVDCQVLGLRSVPDQDWVRLTQSQFAPVRITPQFWIVPSWHEPPPEARFIVRLDPGQAFGTGTHPTTRMCLRWIARRASASIDPAAPGALGRVLDYGCGSGILAIAAAKFGWGEIDAIDLDPAAVESTRFNAAANQVRLRAGPPEVAQGRYDVVLANILATPLKVLAPLLCAHVASGGELVLAGILERQADEMRAAYAAHAKLAVTDREDGWVLMTATL